MFADRRGGFAAAHAKRVLQSQRAKSDDKGTTKKAATEKVTAYTQKNAEKRRKNADYPQNQRRETQILSASIILECSEFEF